MSSFTKSPHPRPLPTRGRRAAHPAPIAAHAHPFATTRNGTSRPNSIAAYLPPPAWGRVGEGGLADEVHRTHTTPIIRGSR